MIPILFDADAKDFGTRGLGPLSDAVSCKVVEERNGTYELTMQYPKDGIHFGDIALNRIVLAIPSPYREPQPFRIYKISTPMRGVVTVNAQHISYDLSGVAVMPFSGSSVADVLSQIKANSVNTNEFEFTGNSAAVAECNYTTPHTARQILGGIEGSVIDRFGGEYEFDKFTVKWSLNRGANNGVTVKYGKNLLTLNQDVDISKIVTGVVPYWADTEGGSAVIGDRVDMDGEYSFEKIIPLDLSQEYQEQPTKEQLEARAKSYIDANYSLEPDINCTVSFALIEQYEEYKDYKLLEKCDLCDIVTVQYPDLGVNSTAKIVKIDTDVLKERYNSVTIGTVRANIAQTIVAQQKAVENIPSRRDVAELVTGALGNITGAQGGAVRLLDTNNDGQPDTLYIADNPDPAEAHKVWRFNYLGWAASSNGYDGPFTLGATLEDGLLADFVTAANLVAGTIKSADNGETFFLDLLNGVLRMKASSFSIEGKSVDDIAGEAAGSALSDAKKYADGKSTTFIVQPTPPYYEGDQWRRENEDVLVCIKDRESGEFLLSDWKKLDKYTDDTAANAAEAHAARNTAEIELTSKEIDLRATKNELGAVEGRLTQAEEKITDDSIVSTVRESQPYQNDLAKIAQTAHEIVMEVTLDKSEYITKANIFSTKNSERGYLNEDGSFVENDNYLTTGYLPVKPKDRIFVQLWLENPYPTVEVELVPEYESEILTYAGANQNYYRASSKNIIIGAAFYDAEKRFISSNIYTPSDASNDYYCVETKFAPDNAAYVRGTSFYKDSSGTYWVQLYNNGTNMSDDIIEEVVEDPDYHSPREDMLTNLSSMISIDEKAIKFVADTLSWESKYSSLSNNGKLKCKDVEMSGKLIDEYKLYGYGFCVGEGNVPLFSYDDGYWSAIGKEGISFGYSEDLNNYGILNKDHPIKLNTLVSNPDGQIKYNPKAYGGATIFLDCYGIDVKNENNEVYSGVTAEIPIITRIENNKSGGITWYNGWIQVVNGIIVDYWDGYT